ncbi:YraN family protein [Campylobacter upsaliensis]|uniref:YraN family protein n=1 Tax=Campylobacter upsaliensis TaxID=28080 RepID=UPI003A599B8E
MGLISHLSGILGENRACAFLKKHRFEILERNFHSKFGEIDIIAKKDEILHFVEVKFTQKDYEPYERLDFKKWLCHNKQLINSHFYRGALKLPYKFELSKIVKPYRLLFFLLLLKQYL